MIKIEAKPYEVKAELPGYGIFYLRHMGAAAEAELRQMMTDCDNALKTFKEKYKDILAKETELKNNHDDNNLASLKSSEEYLEAQNEQQLIQDKMQRVQQFVKTTTVKLWRSDDNNAMKRLLEDFSIKEIQGFYAQVMEQSDNA